MKKIAKSLIILLLLCVMPFNAVTAFASESEDSAGFAITPRMSNLAYSYSTFDIINNEGYATILFEGTNNFSYATVHVKVEKRFLLAFWNDVDEWSTSSSASYGTLTHTFALDGKGTYRATFTLDVTGNDGTVDTITDTITVKTN